MAYKDVEKQKAFQREWFQRRWQAHKETIAELKAGKSCQFCGESEPCCLDFHHMNPATKKFALSSGKHGKGAQVRKPEALREEAKKCILLCRNCHAKLHAGLLG